MLMEKNRLITGENELVTAMNIFSFNITGDIYLIKDGDSSLNLIKSQTKNNRFYTTTTENLQDSVMNATTCEHYRWILLLCWLCRTAPKHYKVVLSFRQARALSSILSLWLNIIDKETFALLHDVNSSNNLHFLHENYDKLDLENLCNDESKTEVRFYENDIFQLKRGITNTRTITLL